MNKKHIVFSIATLMQGGAERVVSVLANYLAKQGHKVELLLYYDREIMYNIDPAVTITVEERHLTRKDVLSHILWKRNYLKKLDPDVFISFLAPFNMLNIVAMAGLKTPVIVADRSDPRRAPSNFFIRKIRDVLYRFADGIVVQNETNKSYFPKWIKNRCKVIYNPVDVGTHKGQSACQGTNNIISVGRIIPSKNPWMLIDAFSVIASEFPSYKLIFYGNGELIEPLKEYVTQKALTGRVEFPGGVANVFEKMCNADLFVMSSDYEGMPNALLEAMCVGLPVISTTVSGAVDVIHHGENGMLVEINNSTVLADTMRALLNDPVLRQQLGTQAAQLADIISVDNIAEEWVRYISSICC